MARILVKDDDGAVVWSERVSTADFETQHFRGCLSQRLSWAVTDAQRGSEPAARAGSDATPDQARELVPA